MLTSPRLRGKGSRGERDGSRVIREGANPEGGARERQAWEKAPREVGTHERRLIEGGKRAAVEFD